MAQDYTTHLRHYGGLTVPGKCIRRIMHYASVIVSDPEGVGCLFRGFLKISCMTYIHR